jgi:hypothetical protein
MRTSTSTLLSANPLNFRFFSSQQRTDQYVNLIAEIVGHAKQRPPRLLF